MRSENPKPNKLVYKRRRRIVESDTEELAVNTKEVVTNEEIVISKPRRGRPRLASSALNYSSESTKTAKTALTKTAKTVPNKAANPVSETSEKRVLRTRKQ